MGETESNWNYAAVLASVAERVSDRTAIVSGSRRMTFGEFDDASARFALGCSARGVGPGDKIAIDLLNCPEYLIAFYGALKLGAIPVNVNYRYRSQELAYLLDYVDASVVVVHDIFADAADAAVDAVGREVLRVLVPYEREPDGSALTIDALMSDLGHGAELDHALSGDDQIFICTGGTTGLPKAVVWRNDDLYVSQWQLSRPGTTPRDPAAAMAQGKRAATTLPAPPLMHGTGLYAALGALSGGGTVVLLDRLSFDPDAVWEAVAKESVQVLTVVGDVFARPLLEALDRVAHLDVSSLRVVSSSGAVLSSDTKAGLIERIPGLRIVDSFGATEGMVSRVVSTDEASASDRFRASENVVVLREGRPVAPGSGEIGYLGVSGRLPLGYYKDPEKSAATFPVIDGKRYSVAGDLATVDADGTIVFLGRGAATINTGGEKVYPAEVEEELRMIAGIADCCVVGVDDPRWGQRVVAVVQPVADAVLDRDRIKTVLRARLAGYKVPKDIVLVPSLERGPNGKIDYQIVGQLATRELTR
jgi:acyl-CoA synthetase (AMP-forming)/AMP-acid ligase II